jgi:hypothetical protein
MFFPLYISSIVLLLQTVHDRVPGTLSRSLQKFINQIQKGGGITICNPGYKFLLGPGPRPGSQLTTIWDYQCDFHVFMNQYSARNVINHYNCQVSSVNEKDCGSDSINTFVKLKDDSRQFGAFKKSLDTTGLGDNLRINSIKVSNFTLAISCTKPFIDSLFFHFQLKSNQMSC